MTVSSACHSAAAPTTTTFRFVKPLEERGLLERSDHPTDRLTRTVTLTKLAANRIRAYLDLLGG